MVKLKKKNSGFSLLELLATILVISLVFGIGGYFISNVIRNSQEKSDDLAISFIKKSASTYVKEYPDDVVWKEKDDASQESYTCVSVSSLVNKGYFKEEEVKREGVTDYIIVTRDASKTIISEEFDTEGLCSGGTPSKKVAIPTSKMYCNELTYSPDILQELVKKSETEGFSFRNTKGTDAGSYKVTATLNEGFVWKDDTIGNKTITCTIKKRTPQLSLTQNGDSGTIGKVNTDIVSDTSGRITLKTSNKNIATASIARKDIMKNVKSTITINKIATRKANTYITATLTPTDQKNYTSASVVYTIGDVKKQTVEKPTAEIYCKNPYYNGTSQVITNQEGEGYQFYDNERMEIGDHYEVTAKIKYGYVWEEDGTTADVKFTCSIRRPTPTVTYNNNGGSGCTSKVVTYEDSYGTLCTPSRTGYTFNGWYTAVTGGSKIEATTKVTEFNNHTIYAHWTANTYTVTYDNNGGSGCSNKSVTYESSYGTLCTPTRIGYNFVGWYTNAYKNIPLNYYADTYSDLKAAFQYNQQQLYSHWINHGQYEGRRVSQYISSDKVSITSNVTIYAGWIPQTYTVTMNANGGTNGSGYSATWTATYGNTYNLDSFIPTRTGYTFLGWYSAASGGARFSGNWTWSATSNYTFYAQWRLNVCTITYHPNGGIFTTNAGDTVQTINYGGSVSNMRNAKKGNYTAQRSGWDINKAVAWKSNLGITYNQGNGYSATDFCPSLASGSQSVILYVNWYQTKYCKKNCRAYKSCATLGCGTKSCNCRTGSCTLWKCSGAGGYTCTKPSSTSCSSCPNGSWVCQSYNTVCDTCYRTCPNSACGCATWSGESFEESCTSNSSTQCRTVKCYYDNTGCEC